MTVPGELSLTALSLCVLAATFPSVSDLCAMLWRLAWALILYRVGAGSWTSPPSAAAPGAKCGRMAWSSAQWSQSKARSQSW